MRTRGNAHLARSFVTIAAAGLVVSGAGFAAARTVGGPPWQQPVLSAQRQPCERSGGATAAGGAAATDGTTVADESIADCTTTTETGDPARRAGDAQVYFDQLGECGTAILGDTNLADANADATSVHAFAALAESLESGQVSHIVQSVRVLLRNCETHGNDGLANALYHHGLNWARHDEHELWLEQKFADKWPDGKPGGGRDLAPGANATTQGRPGEADATEGEPDDAGGAHGNPHASHATWAPGNSGGGHGNGYGHST